MTIGNPAFCLFLYLTDVHFRGELQHGGDVSQQKVKCRPIRTREIGAVSLSDILYDTLHFLQHIKKWLKLLERSRKKCRSKVKFLSNVFDYLAKFIFLIDTNR